MRCKKISLYVAFKPAWLSLLGLVWLAGNWAKAANITWINTSGGDWGNAINWSPSQVPGAGDTAIINANGIYTVTVSSPEAIGAIQLGGSMGKQTLDVSLGSTFQVGGPVSGSGNGTFEINGGTLTGGNQAIVFSIPLYWSGGNIAATVQFPGGTFSGSPTLYGGTLVNTGTLEWNGANVQDGFGSVISNALGATINVTMTNIWLVYDNGGDSPRFINAGQMNFNGVGMAEFYFNSFTNTGTVTVNSGILDLFGGGENDGTISVAAGSALRTDTDFTFNPGSTLADEGDLILANNGVVTLAGNTSVAGTNFFSGATVNIVSNYPIVNPLYISGGWVEGNPLLLSVPLYWSGGNIATTVKFSGGTFSGSPTLYGGTLVNTGTLEWNGANVQDGFGSVISNAPGATINVTMTNTWLVYGYGNGDDFPSFINAGQMNFTGVGIAQFYDNSFTNTGTVTVNGGILDLQGGGENDGTISVAAGSALRTDADFTFNPGSTLADEGDLVLANGLVTLAGNTSVAGTNFFSGATVNIVSNYPIVNPLYISGGWVEGNPLLLSVPLYWSGGTIATTVQFPGGTFSDSPTLYGGTLVNTGTLEWNGANVQDGFGSVISNAPGATINMTFTNALLVSGGNSPSFINAGQINFAGVGTAQIYGNLFINTGTIDVNDSQVFLDAGSFSENGILNFSLNSPSDYGQITVSGSVSLGGTFRLCLNNGYQPAMGDSFTNLYYGSYTGGFANIVVPPAYGWGTQYFPSYFVTTMLGTRPVFTALATNTFVAPEETTLAVTNVATDADLPPQTLTYSLAAGIPGMSVDPVTGVFAWTPQQTNSPSTNLVSVAATDSGNPPLSSTNTFTIIVQEVNAAPVLPTTGIQTVDAFNLLQVTNAATDSNIHALLSYTLVNPPAGMTISTNGVITWTPQNAGTNIITTMATATDVFDTAHPALSATNNFVVIIYPVTLLSNTAYLGDGQFEFSFNTQDGKKYTIEYSGDLIHWKSLLELTGDGQEQTIIDPNADETQGFYRILSP